MPRIRDKRITMVEVAHEAGVSYQTVSRVINDHPSVAPETRVKVWDVIKRLNYHPSKAARSLAARRSSTLAVITYGMQFFGPTQMVVNIEQYAREAGYDIIYSNIDPSDAEMIDIRVSAVSQWSVDGIVVIAPVKSHHYELLTQQFRNIPMIQIDTEPSAPVPSVIINQESGSYVGTKHLIDLGHRHMVCITGPMNWYGAESRLIGYRRALNEAGLTSVGEREGDWTSYSGYRGTQALLKDHRFTGLVVGNDQMALGAIHALAEHGLRIPQDVSVVGFDDIPEASYFLPALTTVKQDFHLLGQMGIQYLIATIQNPANAEGQRVIPTELIVRDSTSVPQL